MYYPLMFNLAGKRCIVVGGGRVAERKVKGLLEYEVEITVISPQITPFLNQAWQEHRLHWHQGPYKRGLLAGGDLVFVATNSPEVSQLCWEEARAEKVLLNVVDLPQLSDFILPAVHRQGALTIAVSTEGNSPLLARKMKEEIANQYGNQYEALVTQLGEIRQRALLEIEDIHKRKALFELLVENGLKVKPEVLWGLYEDYLQKGEEIDDEKD